MSNAIPVTSPDKIHLEALKYRYPMRNVVTLEAEIRQIEACVKRGYQKLELQPLREDWLSVVGYGPSLLDIWQEVAHPIITVSGAHDFLIERGVIPDWHAECDGRDHKTRHLEKPHQDVTYLMATICNPKVWEQLNGCRILRWHNANGKHVVDWIGKNDDVSILVAGGSNIGLTAIHLGGILGFRKFKLFGFDGNLRRGRRHAGPHYGPPQKTIKRFAGGREWDTTPQMSNACDEFLRLIKEPGLEFHVFGTSLLTSVLEDGNCVLRK